MNTPWRILLLGLPLLLIGVEVDAAAQVGRLMGNVAYYGRDRRVFAARGARVVAVGSYVQSETRADAYGNFALMLRPGAYRVYAQGASGYALGQATGYVRANTNSYISPNPVLLMQQSAGNWDGMTSPGPVPASFSVEGVTAPPADSPNLAGTSLQGRPGTLSGRVMIRDDKGRVGPAKNRSVRIQGDYGKAEAQTGSQGDFISPLLRPGQYEIIIVAEGLQQEPDRVIGLVRPGRNSPVLPNTIWLIAPRKNPPSRTGKGE